MHFELDESAYLLGKKFLLCKSTSTGYVPERRDLISACAHTRRKDVAIKFHAAL